MMPSPSRKRRALEKRRRREMMALTRIQRETKSMANVMKPRRRWQVTRPTARRLLRPLHPLLTAHPGAMPPAHHPTPAKLATWHLPATVPAPGPKCRHRILPHPQMPPRLHRPAPQGPRPRPLLRRPMSPSPRRIPSRPPSLRPLLPSRSPAHLLPPLPPPPGVCAEH